MLAFCAVLFPLLMVTPDASATLRVVANTLIVIGVVVVVALVRQRSR